jgi:hypothetical protein
MAYDEALAVRIRRALPPDPRIREIKMFGGLAFVLDGKMFCAVVGDELMVRVGAEAYRATLARPHVRAMDFTGRPLTGLVFVAPAGVRGAALARWLEKARAYVEGLPMPKRRPRPRAVRPRPKRR